MTTKWLRAIATATGVRRPQSGTGDGRVGGGERIEGMAFTLRKVRVVVVVGAALLVAVVAGFVWYGQRASRLWFKALPKKLGMHIVQETDHFTYSQSSAGKTVFTVRAAKEVQRDDGKVRLFDAGIDLFGRQDGKADKIHGAEFEFDQKAGLLTAVGDVYIDLAAPESKNGKAAGADDDARMVHVKTSGLVFNQKERSAATDQRVEFQTAGLTGTGVGADYESATRRVVLRSDVHVSGLRNGRPVVLTAANAVMDRVGNVLNLLGAKYVAGAAPGPANGLASGRSESLAADEAVVRLEPDGTPERVDAEGHVVLASVGKGAATGDRLEVELNDEGQARAGHLWGHVVYRQVDDRKETRGAAEDVRVGFDGAGRPQHAVLTGAVEMEEKTVAAGRALRGGKVELALSERVKGKVEVEQMTATGAASLRLAEAGEKGRTATDVSADTLVARFAPGVGEEAERVTGMTGTGHTVVHQVGVTGAEETSAGDALEASFTSDGKGIERAVQRGGVKTVRVIPAHVGAGGKKVAATTEHAAADVASFDGAANKLVLTGGVQVADETSSLTADQVGLDRGTGDATATGNVRVSYAAADGKGEPLHVVAQSAVERKASSSADFFGVPGRPARMWQGLSQVEAPVLHFANDAAGKRMVANGGDGVRAVLVQDSGKGRGAAARITGKQMTYSEATREVVFDGPVRVEDQGAVMVAREATAYLAAPSAGAGAVAAGPGGFPAGRVDHMVATGAVEVDEPGRRATGERLVYTAADQTFVMTGTKAAPPKVVDESEGTVTGGMVRFRQGEKAVMVTGDAPGAGTTGGRVHSETRVKP